MSGSGADSSMFVFLICTYHLSQVKRRSGISFFCNIICPHSRELGCLENFVIVYCQNTGFMLLSRWLSHSKNTFFLLYFDDWNLSVRDHVRKPRPVCRWDNGSVCVPPIYASFGPQNITVITSQESHYWNAFLIGFTKTHFLHPPNYG